MPLGTLHTVEGVLHFRDRRIFLSGHGGGEWELEMSRSFSRYRDRAVVVEGVRTGFNRLEVVRIKGRGEEWPRQQSWTGWFERWQKCVRDQSKSG